MNTYINFAIFGITFITSLVFSYILLKQKIDQKQNILSKLDTNSLLIINLIMWVATILITPKIEYGQISTFTFIITSLCAVILPLCEIRFQKVKRFSILFYMAAAIVISTLFLDASILFALAIAISWGAFTFLFDKFNGEAKIAPKSLICIFVGILFLSLFLPLNTAIMYLVAISGLCLVAFNMASKNELINMQLSIPTLHGFTFIIGMFLAYIASLGYYAQVLIIPTYFVTELVIFYITIAMKKLFKKDTRTTFFFEKAIERGANFPILSRYIATMASIFIMIAALYSPELRNLLFVAILFVISKILYDLKNWGQRIPGIRESWKNAFADAKKASSEATNNIKSLFSKINKKEKEDK